MMGLVSVILKNETGQWGNCRAACLCPPGLCRPIFILSILKNENLLESKFSTTVDGFSARSGNYFFDRIDTWEQELFFHKS